MKLFDANIVGSNNQYVQGITNYVSGNQSLDLAQGETGKALSSVSNAIEGLANNVCVANVSKSVGTYNIATGSAIKLDSAIFDKFNLYNKDLGAFTAPITGVVCITICMGVTNPSGALSIYAVKNNQSSPGGRLNDPTISSLIFGTSASVANGMTINATWYCPVNRGDVIVLFNNGGSFDASYNDAQITMKW